MSAGEVEVIEAAVSYADSLFDGAPFAGMDDHAIDHRYAQWIVEWLREHGWIITRLEQQFDNA